MPNDNALLTVADLQVWLPSLADAQAEEAINWVSDSFEEHCGRVFRLVSCVEVPTGDQAPLEVQAGSGQRLLYLDRWPIVSVERITVGGEVITDYSTANARELKEGALFRARGWRRLVGNSGPLTYDADPSDAFPTIQIAYTGGYDEIPAALKKAAVNEIAAMTGGSFGNRIIEEQTAGGRRLKYELRSDEDGFYALGTKAALATFKRIFI